MIGGPTHNEIIMQSHTTYRLLMTSFINPHCSLIAVGIDFGTIKTVVSAPLRTFFSSSTISPEYSDYITTARNIDEEKITPTRVFYDKINTYVGVSAKRKGAVTQFTNLDNQKNLRAARKFLKQLLSSIKGVSDTPTRLQHIPEYDFFSISHSLPHYSVQFPSLESLYVVISLPMFLTDHITELYRDFPHIEPLYPTSAGIPSFTYPFFFILYTLQLHSLI